MIALGQCLLPLGGTPPETPGLAARRTRPISIPAPPVYGAILAAPVFAPDRRPVAAAAAGAAAANAPLAGYAAVGVATGRAAATAVVTVPGGQNKIVHRGDTLGGWRLIGIDRTHLTFENNGVRHDLVVGAPAVEITQAPSAGTEQ